MSGISLLPIVSSVMAIVMAFVIGGIFLQANGKDALHAYKILFERGLLDKDGLTETFKKMAPMLIVSAGLLIALRASVWNIGIDGQFMVGALLAGVASAASAPTPLPTAKAVPAALCTTRPDKYSVPPFSAASCPLLLVRVVTLLITPPFKPVPAVTLVTVPLATEDGNQAEPFHISTWFEVALY